jgi:hypothetical protein
VTRCEIANALLNDRYQLDWPIADVKVTRSVGLASRHSSDIVDYRLIEPATAARYHARKRARRIR